MEWGPFQTAVWTGPYIKMVLNSSCQSRLVTQTKNVSPHWKFSPWFSPLFLRGNGFPNLLYVIYFALLSQWYIKWQRMASSTLFTFFILPKKNPSQLKQACWIALVINTHTHPHTHSQFIRHELIFDQSLFFFAKT